MGREARANKNRPRTPRQKKEIKVWSQEDVRRAIFNVGKKPASAMPQRDIEVLKID